MNLNLTRILHLPLQFVERQDTTGGVTLEQCRETGLGFCPDFSPDKAVGRAMERLLVGSQDVAHDYPRLRELGRQGQEYMNIPGAGTYLCKNALYFTGECTHVF